MSVQPRVKRLQFDRATRIVARLMLRNSGYYELSPETALSLAEELADLLGLELKADVSRETEVPK